MPYEMTQSQMGDYEAGVTFARALFRQFKQKNKDEGINGLQALWIHHRMRAWNVTFMGVPFIEDVINMGASGDIETACLSLMYGQPDDMTMPYHWLSQSRVNWLITEMKAHLGWP